MNALRWKGPGSTNIAARGTLRCYILSNQNSQSAASRAAGDHESQS